MAPKVEIRRTLRGPVPRLPYEAMAREILPGNYELSLVLCGDTLARRINVEHRKKAYYPNVLSFEFDRASGEIFLNMRKAAREARQYGVSLKARAALLYVHGLFHLLGEKHGERMEHKEQRVLRKFGLQ